MAKMPKQSASISSPGPQSPSDTWSPNDLTEALTSGSIDQKRAAVRAAGIIDEDGKITKKYRNWGGKITRTSTTKNEK